MASNSNNTTWLSHLSSHPTFSSPSTSTQPSLTPSADRKNTFGISNLAAAEEDEFDESLGGDYAQRRERCVVRGGRELIVLVGKEVRVMDLGEAKGDGEERYWILQNPDIDFQVHQLVLNPTNKLLALVGRKELAVIMLPPLGSLAQTTPAPGSGSAGKIVKCKGTKIACELYNETGKCNIVKTRWHPWGEHGTSLLVLTDDTILREFDTSHSSSIPLQAIPLHPSVPFPSLNASSSLDPNGPNTNPKTSRKSTFTAEDVSGRTAVSFDIGKGEGEWGSLAVWGLMGNGDVWTICPFLPEFAIVPENHIQALNLYLGSKAQQHRTSHPSSTSALTNSTRFSLTEHGSLGKRLAAQQKWARSLNRQIDAHKSDESFSSNLMGDHSYPVRPPRDGKRVKRQGPYLVLPEPSQLPLSEEAGWGVEGVASDILVLADHVDTLAKGHKDTSSTRTGLNVIALSWMDGRVDLHLETQKVEAEWEVDEQLKEEEEEPLPTLVAFDSVDLQILENLQNQQTESLSSVIPHPPLLLKDPLDPTSIYVQHALGVHWISIRPFVTALAQALTIQDVEQEAMEMVQLWKRKVKCLSDWAIDTWTGQNGQSALLPVVGIAVISDIDIGYALLALTSERDCIGLPMNEFEHAPTQEVESLGLSRMSLAGANSSSEVAEPLTSYLGGETSRDWDYTPILKAKDQRMEIVQSVGSKRLDDVSATDLKTMGTLTQAYGEAILEVKKIANRVEGRADLQVKEVAWQLQRLKEAMKKVAELKGEQSDDHDEGLLGQGVGGSVDDMKKRFERIMRTQRDINQRVTSVQTTLMNNLQPGLTVKETEWQAELQRTEALLSGGESSLDGKRSSLERRLAAVQPEYKRAASKTAFSTSTNDRPAPEVASQIKQETENLELLMRKVKKIRARVDELSV